METKKENILEVLLQRRKDTNTLSGNIGEDIDEGWERMTLVCTEDDLSYSHTDGRRDNFPYFDFFDKGHVLLSWLLKKEYVTMDWVVARLEAAAERMEKLDHDELDEHSLQWVLEDVEEIKEDKDEDDLEKLFTNYEYALGRDCHTSDRRPMSLENDHVRRTFMYMFSSEYMDKFVNSDEMETARERIEDGDIEDGDIEDGDIEDGDEIIGGNEWTLSEIYEECGKFSRQAEAEIEYENKIYKRILELDDRCRAYRLELVHEDAPWRGVPDIVIACIYFPDSIESLKLKKKLYGDYSGEGVADIEALCKEYEITEDELALCALFLDDSGYPKHYHVKEFPEILERITQNHLDRAKAYVRNHHILRNARKVVKYIQDCLEGQSSITPRLLLAVDGNTKLTDNFLNTIYQCHVNEELFPAAKTFSDLSRLEKELNEIPFC